MIMISTVLRILWNRLTKQNNLCLCYKVRKLRLSNWSKACPETFLPLWTTGVFVLKASISFFFSTLKHTQELKKYWSDFFTLVTFFVIFLNLYYSYIWSDICQTFSCFYVDDIVLILAKKIQYLFVSISNTN